MTERPKCPQCGSTKTYECMIADNGYILRRTMDLTQCPFHHAILCMDCREFEYMDEDDHDTVERCLHGTYRLIHLDYDIMSERHCGCDTCTKERNRGTILEYV